MRITHFDEPELEFGTHSHIDIRFGLMNYGPFDYVSELAPKTIQVGVVGSAASIEGVREWLKRCRNEIAAKESRQPNLFPKFPGFNTDCGFHSEIAIDSSLERQIPSKRIEEISHIALLDELRIEAVKTIVEEVRFLQEKKPPNVIVCAIPQELLNALDPIQSEGELEDESIEDGPPSSKIDFRDMLKARSMNLPRACPIQVVLPATYDPSKRRRGKTRRREVRPLQDEATRAWNFHAAMYYKAGGTPWRLKEEPAKLQTCFVGIGFFRTLDGERLSTSVAQVFNERGNGVVVRGGPAVVSKEDRQPHLDENAAHNLMVSALHQYKQEHYTMPARVVVHKSSVHNDAEVKGFTKAIEEFQIHSCEMISLRKSFTRLFRKGLYPPLRGTFLTLDDNSHVLYTRGSVDFYATYPGMYMPRTVRIGCDQIEQTPRYLAEEILALTKMNWNDTQFDGGFPITLRAAREVGDILKYLGPEDAIQPHYSFYM